MKEENISVESLLVQKNICQGYHAKDKSLMMKLCKEKNFERGKSI